MFLVHYVRCAVSVRVDNSRHRLYGVPKYNGPQKSQSRKILVKFCGSHFCVCKKPSQSLEFWKQRKAVKKHLGLAKICLVSESRKVLPWPFNTPYLGLYNLLCTYRNINWTNSHLTILVSFVSCKLNFRIFTFTLGISYR